jgi:long-chain acyl-CoA synthetase
MSVQTLNDIFLRTIALDRPAAMKFKKQDQWVDVTVPELERATREVSSGLRALGVRSGDRVAILSQNRPEWTISDFAILALGAVSVPVYPTLLAKQIEFILEDSGAVAILAEDAAQRDKVLEVRGALPALRHLIVFDPAAAGEGVLALDQLRAQGRELEGKEGKGKFDELVRQARPDDLATLVYTSGTTGNPKGAMLTHGNITSNVVATCSVMPFETGDIALSILPLSHILERMADFSYLYKGGTIAYAEEVAKVRDNILEVRPDLFAAVPRLFEKMQAAIMDNVAQAPAIRQKLFHWALGVAKERLPYIMQSKPMPPILAMKSAVATRLVFSKIHQRLGGRLRFVLSGGAPLSPELAEFFIGAGVDILEGYGLTETSPVIAVNTPEHRKIGTVGKVVPGVEVKIAEDGEILTRGPHVMKGYYNAPEATAEAIDADGWFHTGDIGELDAEGFLRITDRKKDLIITAYGKNIAPQPLENRLKSSPYISTPVLLGDRRQYLIALIVPNFERLEREMKEQGSSFSSPIEMVKDQRVRAIIQREIDQFNGEVDSQAQIRRFEILPREFTIDEDEITPSLKVKRKVIDRKYGDIIERLYAE